MAPRSPAGLAGGYTWRKANRPAFFASSTACAVLVRPTASSARRCLSTSHSSRLPPRGRSPASPAPPTRLPSPRSPSSGGMAEKYSVAAMRNTEEGLGARTR